MSEVKEAFELRAVDHLKGQNYFVDDYQRGYKWACQQTLDLLNDINDFNIKDGIYCLQPIIVKERNDIDKKLYYELIDGQQRATTIFMILTILNEESFYIKYGTREKSAEFLKNIHLLDNIEIDLEISDDVNYFQKQLENYWEEYISDLANKQYDNVDNYHFFLSYNTIRIWCAKLDEENKTSFVEKLLFHTNVIWYQVNQNESSERVFMNINSGKIQLTSSELIKALFLINTKVEGNKELTRARQSEIAMEWDRIENSLQEDEFWYFINDDPLGSDTPTRIDFLFDLVNKKPKSEKDTAYSYRKFAKKLKDGEELNWEEIRHIFEKLTEWYKNDELYHLIGFIIDRGLSSIPKLVELSKEEYKTIFKQKVLDIIRNEIQKDRYKIDELDYEQNYNAVLTVLLLFNIESYQISESNYRFSFYKFKKERWSIEHIHAQNARLFETISEIKDWAIDQIQIIDDHQVNESKENNYLELVEKLRKYSQLTQEEELTEELKEEITELSTTMEIEFDLHHISNLALLDGNTNSALGNKNFLGKRQEILRIDKNENTDIKAFIPMCTKNVFLKYYTKNDRDIQMSYWSFNDGEDYKSKIKEILTKYYN